jgi:hypothetical protein
MNKFWTMTQMTELVHWFKLVDTLNQFKKSEELSKLKTSKTTFCNLMSPSKFMGEICP